MSAVKSDDKNEPVVVFAHTRGDDFLMAYISFGLSSNNTQKE